MFSFLTDFQCEIKLFKNKGCMGANNSGDVDVCMCIFRSCVCVLQHQSFPQSKNGFRVGMRLEGIDPLRPSMYCVLSVAEVTT